MRLVGIQRLELGTVLARDVLTGRHGRVPLLVRGTVLDRRRITSLERAGIYAVYVDDDLSRGIEVPQVLTDDTRGIASAALEAAFKKAAGGLAGEDGLSQEGVNELSDVARRIADEIAKCGDAVVALQDLAAADAYTLQHSVDVTALGLLVARRWFYERGWIDYRGERRYDKVDERLVQLGLGLMLHDIGKLIVPAEILNKAGSLTDTEWELVRRHPLAGLDLLSTATVSPLARVVIRSHHERWDGSGYPDGKAGGAIHQFARIAAVADVYDAVTSERPYRGACPPHKGWQVIVDGAGSAFDPEVISIFRRVVAPYPPGAEITLEDGRRGVVVDVPLGRLEQPRVRIGWDAEGRPVAPYELDLTALPGRDALAA